MKRPAWVLTVKAVPKIWAVSGWFKFEKFKRPNLRSRHLLANRRKLKKGPAKSILDGKTVDELLNLKFRTYPRFPVEENVMEVQST